MLIIPIHHWLYMRFYIYGASFADNVYGLIDSYEQSPLHKLTNKDDIKVIETTLKTNNIIPSWVTMRTKSQKGGKYRVFALVISSYYAFSHDILYR